MSRTTSETPVIFILFGAAGDLSHRLILPALQALHLHRGLPRQFCLIGTDRAKSPKTRFTSGPVPCLSLTSFGVMTTSTGALMSLAAPGTA